MNNAPYMTGPATAAATLAPLAHPAKRTRHFGLRLNEEMSAMLAAAAREERRTPSDLVRIMIEDGLAERAARNAALNAAAAAASRTTHAVASVPASVR